jgi:hypothetical protein
MNSRRLFLKKSAALLAFAAANEMGFAEFARAEAAKDSHWLLLADGNFKPLGIFKEALIEPGHLAAYNLAGGEKISIAVPFFGHEAAVNPTDKMKVFTALKWGRRAALVDFKDKRVVHEIEPPRGMRFFGHAAWSADGRKIFVTAQNDGAFKGVILAYSSHDLKLQSQWETGGRFGAHQLSRARSGRLEFMLYESGDGGAHAHGLFGAGRFHASSV